MTAARPEEDGPRFARLRWAALAWMAVYLPAYALAYGFANFLFLCNLTVVLVALPRRAAGAPRRGAAPDRLRPARLPAPVRDRDRRVSLGRLLGPAANANHACVDPILRRTWGGALTHVTVVAGALVLVAYPVAHLLLLRLCRPVAPAPLGAHRATGVKS